MDHELHVAVALFVDQTYPERPCFGNPMSSLTAKQPLVAFGDADRPLLATSKNAPFVVRPGAPLSLVTSSDARSPVSKASPVHRADEV